VRYPEASETEMLQATWSAYGKDRETMEVVLTADQLSAQARSREKFSSLVRLAILVFMVAIAAGLLYDIYRVDQPWIRIGVAWTLCVVVYLFGPAIGSQAQLVDTGETCARFLENEHEERRRHYLRIRNRLFLFVPGILACWFGRAAALLTGSSAAGFAPAWLFLLSVVALVLVWFAFTKAAEKAARDRDEIHRIAGD
jgi:hypothetical protein